MSWLQIHVCNPCGLQTPSFKFASSLISAKWRFFSPRLPQLGRYGEHERKEVIVFNESLPYFFFYNRVTFRPPPPLPTPSTLIASLTVTNAFMCPSQRSVAKQGQLLIIKRYLFGSCRVLNSSSTWHFFVILAAL